MAKNQNSFHTPAPWLVDKQKNQDNFPTLAKGGNHSWKMDDGCPSVPVLQLRQKIKTTVTSVGSVCWELIRFPNRVLAQSGSELDNLGQPGREPQLWNWWMAIPKAAAKKSKQFSHPAGKWKDKTYKKSSGNVVNRPQRWSIFQSDGSLTMFDNFNNFGEFWQFWAILTILVNFDNFGQF